MPRTGERGNGDTATPGAPGAAGTAALGPGGTARVGTGYPGCCQPLPGASTPSTGLLLLFEPTPAG